MSVKLRIEPPTIEPLKTPTPKTPVISPAALVTPLGLGITAFGRYPNEVQYYLKKALIFLGLPLTENVGSIAGTVPELVFYGLLLEHGFTPTKQGFLDKSDRSFIFQSKLLGGRQPGGAVADFVVYTGGVTVAVRVESVFHSIQNPFHTGGAQVESDIIQRLRVASSPGIDRVIDVNRNQDNNPLEKGPLEMIHRDYERVMGRL